MTFNGFIANDRLFITYNNKAVLNNIKMRLNFPHARDRVLEFVPCRIEQKDNEIKVGFKRNPERDWMPEAGECSVTFKELSNVLICEADLNCNDEPGYHNYVFDGFESAKLDFEIPDNSDGSMILHTLNPYWLASDFRPLKEVAYPIDSVSAKLSDKHLHILPVYSKDVACELRETGLVINTRMPNLVKISGAVMGISVSDDPLFAIEQNVKALEDAGIITTKSVADKPYPKALEGFGWCTWNAFYENVTADKIITKMEEFSKMNFIPKWVLIDDGWSQYKDGKLLSFYVDKEKFPNGLKDLVEKVKSYGVEAVGVWHAIGGYWHGVHEDGELYKENPDMFYKIPAGNIYPGHSKENAFKFYDEWYEYLQGEGIDFVKVDSQATILAKFDNLYQGAGGSMNIASALDEAAQKHFGGAIINCMGSTLENIVSRPTSLINRNSDDFYPNKEEDFSLHTVQNVYVAALQKNFHCCDFDMFFSKHHTALGSAVIRAISGGPVYVSDEIGKTDLEIIRKLCDEKGNLPKFDGNAAPTLDCFYTDCEKQAKVLKAFNKAGDNIAVGYFGVTPEKTSVGELKLSDIPNIGDRYIAHDYFSDTYTYLDRESKIDLSLEYNGYGLITLYPIKDDDTVALGDKSYFAEAATKPQKICNYKELI